MGIYTKKKNKAVALNDLNSCHLRPRSDKICQQYINYRVKVLKSMDTWNSKWHLQLEALVNIFDLNFTEILVFWTICLPWDVWLPTKFFHYSHRICRGQDMTISWLLIRPGCVRRKGVASFLVGRGHLFEIPYFGLTIFQPSSKANTNQTVQTCEIFTLRFCIQQD